MTDHLLEILQNFQNTSRNLVRSLYLVVLQASEYKPTNPVESDFLAKRWFHHRLTSSNFINSNICVGVSFPYSYPMEL